MKNALKLIAIIALVAVIGFSMVACGEIDVPVSEVTLNKNSISLTVGGTETLTATVSPSDATNKSVGWSSSNSNVATVTYGTVTAVAAGSATITVTTADGGKTATCSVTVTGGSSSSQSLDGIWRNESGSVKITVSGSTGILTAYPSTVGGLSQSAIEKGYVVIGTTQYWRNLTSSGNLTWSGQHLTINYYTSNPNVAIGTTYNNCTFTLSADGQTLSVTSSTSGGGAFTDTWTRETTYSIDGIWSNPSGSVKVTVSGSTGILTAYPSTVGGLSQSAIEKGYVVIGTTQYWRNLTSSGNLTWSGQHLTINYYTSSPDVAIGTTYNNCTFTLSADGQTLSVTGSTSGGGSYTDTWTRNQ